MNSDGDEMNIRLGSEMRESDGNLSALSITLNKNIGHEKGIQMENALEAYSRVKVTHSVQMGNNDEKRKKFAQKDNCHFPQNLGRNEHYTIPEKWTLYGIYQKFYIEKATAKTITQMITLL
jgi:hypothetical protein